MAKQNVRKDDTVRVMVGKDADKEGKVLSVLPAEGKVSVEGINLVKRHTKPRPPKFPQGGIIEKALPIDISNVMLVCPHCNKPTRVARRKSDDVITGKSRGYRVCKRCGETI